MIYAEGNLRNVKYLNYHQVGLWYKKRTKSNFSFAALKLQVDLSEVSNSKMAKPVMQVPRLCQLYVDASCRWNWSNTLWRCCKQLWSPVIRIWPNFTENTPKKKGNFWREGSAQASRVLYSNPSQCTLTQTGSQLIPSSLKTLRASIETLIARPPARVIILFISKP